VATSPPPQPAAMEARHNGNSTASQERRAGSDAQPSTSTGCHQVQVNDSGNGPLVEIIVRGGEPKQVCRHALCVFSVHTSLRKGLISFVEWKWVDAFIIFCIMLNSLFLGLYHYRAVPGDSAYELNEFINGVADHVLWAIFSTESVLKIFAWGFVRHRFSYLRDPWNVLDFVVVLIGLLERLQVGGKLSFLRLFRLLRPLRSLNAVKSMKVLVNTFLKSIMRLGNVLILGLFLFLVFSIIGISLMNGIFYRQCYETRDPELRNGCWEWNSTGGDRLCGGDYMCAEGGFCGGHEKDLDEFRPRFHGGKRDFDWCENSEPAKVFPETDFVHFDHVGGAILLIFQSMTLEGWTDLMYMIEDGFSSWASIIYFLAVVVLTNFFMINVALAVIDEVQDTARDEADEDEEENQEGETKALTNDAPNKFASTVPEPVEPWSTCCLVKPALEIAESEIFSNFILIIIFGNVINMCLGWFTLTDPFGYAVLAEVIEILELLFLAIFVVEMAIMITAFGPCGYVKNPITCFDGIVVIISIVETIVNKTSDGGAGVFTVFRTFRLFRVLNKLANKWSKLKILLKATVFTAKSMVSWVVLFLLFLFICTLFMMQIFATSFHFEDPDSLAPLVPKQYHGEVWCPQTQDARSWHFRQECIPRANFDTFVWAFVTVFQVMTGENWNTIMYAGMRASQRWETPSFLPPTLISAIIFIFLILIGQTLFLSMFLSLLISTFDEVSSAFQEKESLMTSQKIELKRQASRVDEQKVAKGIVGRWTVSARVHPERVPVEDAQDGEPPPDGTVTSDSLQNFEDPATTPSPKTPMSQQIKKGLTNFGSTVSPRSASQKKGYPYGYALCIFSETNPIRRAAKVLLEKKITIRDMTFNIFDNLILVCILVSTLCMMLDEPLADPRSPLSITIKYLDTIFAIIFIIEMVIKLVALGLFFMPGAYLKSPWNWLDAIVVMVSIIDFAVPNGPGFLRVLRILRTFRPLRIISRNENLRVVVQALLQSMGDLLGLVCVFMLIQLIFALFFLMFLKGTLFTCSHAEDVSIGYLGSFYGELGDDFVTPLCLGVHGGVNGQIEPLSLAKGSFQSSTGKWSSASCGSTAHFVWQRSSADTPICVARCDPSLDFHPGIEELCHRRYTVPQELPSGCGEGEIRILTQSTKAQEEVGEKYIADMQRAITLPCGGFAFDQGKGQVVANASQYSCRSQFCRDVDKPPSDACVKECKVHTYFCKDSCKQDDASPQCQTCRKECESACMCEQFCTPLIKDAALCVEQGGQWGHVLSQNFDNIISSLLTLFEISTTEGWVDVMYAAADVTGVYRQPIRDFDIGIWVVAFPMWILVSFMFLINLAVGVIVDNFGAAMDRGNGGSMLTESQQRWLQSRKSLHSRAFFFDLRNLHELPSCRRKVYDLVTSVYFERAIMATIILNTLIMALTIFPAPTEEWKAFQSYANYVFVVIYTVEAILKLIALRCNYWLDSWNRFDFFCVVATLVGIVLSLPGINIDVRAATSVIRILRVARLFRLLRFLRELNRLFMCLISSIPKLYNVMMILGLFLILFSILGMSLFGTAKYPEDGTLDVHGNFQTFWRSFITLFRASTGEAWNEIMHDLAKTEQDYFVAGDWCTPQGLFKLDTEEEYLTLKEKCLIDNPNACPGSWNPLPAIFWVAYTNLITFMIMNLVVAVILEGYEEGKSEMDTDNIDTCIEVWKRYDPDHKMKISLKDALAYIVESVGALDKLRLSDGHKERPLDISNLQGASIAEIARNQDMREMKNFWVVNELQVDSDQQVSFISAARQVLRLMSVEDQEQFECLDVPESELPSRERERLKRLERTLPKEGGSIAASVAAQKIQDKFRARRARKKEQNNTEDLRTAAVGGNDCPELVVTDDTSDPTLVVPARAG